MTTYAAWRDSVQDLALDVAPLAVLDTETTGLARFGPERDRIIELCILHGTLREGVTVALHQYLEPEGRPICPEAQAVNGLSLEVLQAAYKAGDIVRFRDIAGSVIELVNGRIPVAHRLYFDAEMLYGELRGGAAPPADWQPRGLCTNLLGWAAFPHLAQHSLANLCGAVGHVNPAAHTAKADSLAHYAVLRGCVAELRSQGHALATVGEALDAMTHGATLRRRLRGAP